MPTTPVAIVTGSTSGIGLAIAEALAAHAYHVVLNGLGTPDAIQALCARFRDAGHSFDYDPADMAQPEQVRQLVAQTVARRQRLDVLVNNAGIQHTARTEDFPTERWDAVLAVNLSAAFHATQAALPAMQRQGNGRIINIASVHGLVASTDKVAYVAAKHGLVGMTKVVALENAQRGITCNALCPGWVQTPLVERQIHERAQRLNVSVQQAQHELLAEKQPSLRFTQASEVAETVLFLCSPAAANITGTTLTLDGGWTAR